LQAINQKEKSAFDGSNKLIEKHLDANAAGIGKPVLPGQTTEPYNF